MKVWCVFLLSSALGLVEAMVELNHAMFQARNLQEFREAFQGTKSTDGWQQRDRHLQELQLEDSKPIYADYFGGKVGFYHGVASGDPLPDSVIIWTRYTPMNGEPVELELRMAKQNPSIPLEDHLDPEKNSDLRRAKIQVTEETDFVVKIDVTGLEEGTDYVFAFSDGEVVSPIGRTKTAPGPDVDVESMVYAVFSCSHFANGYFHAYDIASTIKDLDFWVHVGDYVYEYGLYSPYASDSPERKEQILPLWEQISLQDHRNRMATYHLDEGLRNLRARAPLIACWDDHESTNNPYGDGTPENTGAENHQEVCRANVTSPDEEKDAAKCDRDEGAVTKRFNDAAQSYFEWMPIRRYNGKMGVVTIGSINQVISWGDMATIVTFDTRLTMRSSDPTVNSSTFNAFLGFAAVNNNVSEYSTTLSGDLEAISDSVHLVLENPEFTMVGNLAISFLKSAFAKSASAGQPWQIWATATALGRAVKGDYSRLSELTDPLVSGTVRNITEAIFSNPNSAFLRALTAQSITHTPWNRDDFSGFAHEQRKILDAMKSVSNNPIVLAGDLHDGYGWQLFEGGAFNGTPCAVNLVCPGVTSPGWGPFVMPAFTLLADVVGGQDEVYNLLEEADEAANPGLVYFNHQYKGFFAVKATKEEHIAEFFVIEPEVILTNYTAARAASGGIVADFLCDAQLTTTAGLPGSLDRRDSCGAIEFESMRSPIETLPFPLGALDDGLPVLVDCDYRQCDFDYSTGVPDFPTDPPGAGTSTDVPTNAPETISSIPAQSFWFPVLSLILTVFA